MFIYNKDMLRKIGKDEAFIEGLPDLVEKGEFTMTDLSNLAKEVVDQGAAEFGILHRPNTGPDYLMTFAAFGVRFVDDDSGQLLLPKAEMQAALEWYDWNARNGVTPENNTAMSWDEIQSAFKQEKAFAYHHGVLALPEWQLGDAKGATWPTDEEGYFEKIGWIHAPAPEKGGEPTNLSHPIVYVVNPQSPNAELAAMLVAFASLPYYNTQHAVGSAHTGITQGQLSMPAYQEAWYLQAATPMLDALDLHAQPPRLRPLQRHPLQGAAGRRDRPALARGGGRVPRGRDDQRARRLAQGRGQPELRPGRGRAAPFPRSAGRLHDRATDPSASRHGPVPGAGLPPARVLLPGAGDRQPGSRLHRHGAQPQDHGASRPRTSSGC